MAFGISSDKVLRRAAEAKVKPPTQNLVLQLFGAQADRIAGALSQGVGAITECAAVPVIPCISQQVIDARAVPALGVSQAGVGTDDALLYARAMPTHSMPSDQPSNSCATSAQETCQTHSPPLRDEALGPV